MTPTRFLMAGLTFFGVATVVAIATALLAPIDAIRFLGVVALAFAGTGFILQLHALRRLDPDAYMALALRSRAALLKGRAIGARAAAFVAGNSHSTRSRSAH